VNARSGYDHAISFATNCEVCCVGHCWSAYAAVNKWDKNVLMSLNVCMFSRGFDATARGWPNKVMIKKSY